MTPDQIKAALKAGIITQSQADDMLGKAGNASSQAARPIEDEGNIAVIGNEENLRFIRGFSDVFIAIGVVLLAIGLSALSALMGGGLVYIGSALVMALMADYFGRKKRAHLPTLITALAFLLFTQKGVGGFLADTGMDSAITTSLITLGAMLLFYWRVRLPFCVALIALSVLSLFYTLLFRLAPDLTNGNVGWFLALGGLATFAVALYYDSKDLHRTTRFSDNAFWLHLAAAPLLIHGLATEAVTMKANMAFGLIPMVDFKESDAAIILIIIGFVTFVGLAINRRALIVSSLGYAAFAIGYLIKNTGLGFGTVITITLLVLGAAIVFLGAGWHHARGALLKILPKWRVFPPPYDPQYQKKS